MDRLLGAGRGASPVLISVALLLLTHSATVVAEPSVTWSPSAAVVLLPPNSSTSVVVRVTATEPVPGAQVRVTPSLSKYVAVSPTVVTSLVRNQSIDVTLTLSLPIDASPDSLTGTLQLRTITSSGVTKETIARPLPITINVLCPCLPPDPGEAGKLTLEGVDSDSDGVRDDLQRWISVNHPESQRKREALFQFTRSSQQQLVTQTTPEARALALQALRALDCLDHIGGDGLAAEYQIVVPVLTNTEERLLAWINYQGLLAGMGWTVPLATSAADCDFDPASLED